MQQFTRLYMKVTPLYYASGFRAPSSIPEVVGNAAKMFNPQSEEDIKHTMENVLLSETKLKEMKIRGLRHYKKFTWENCTKKTSKVYKCLL